MPASCVGLMSSPSHGSSNGGAAAGGSSTASLPVRAVRTAWRNLTGVFTHSPEEFEQLNGIRAICCIWIVCFHVMYLSSSVTSRAEYDHMFHHWSMFFIRFGFSCVDVFFVMTGFLLCYPYFLKEFKLNRAAASKHKSAAAAAAATADGEGERVAEFKFNRTYDTTAFSSVGITDYWYKRFIVRIYPPLAQAVLIHCCLLFADGKFVPFYNQTRQDAIFTFTRDKYLPDLKVTDPMPNSCDLFPANFLMLNNKIPFGGCMGWTWSLAIQGQFYFVLPILLRLTKRASRFMVVAAVFLAINVWSRYTSFMGERTALQGRPAMTMDSVSDFAHYAIWFGEYYTPTFNRIGSIVIGSFAAYIQARVSVSSESESRVVRIVNRFKAAPLLVHLVVFGWALYAFTRHKDWDTFSAWYMIMEFIGGPIFSVAFAYIMFIALNRVSVIGETLSSILSWRVWGGISKVSYSIYLLHCSFISYSFQTLFPWGQHQPPGQITIWFMWRAIIFNIAAVVAVCAVLYAFIEKPITDYLSGGVKRTTLAATAGSPKEAVAKRE